MYVIHRLWGVCVCVFYILPMCVLMNVIDKCVSFVCMYVCCSSLLLQKLEPVLCVVRAAAAGVNSLAVVCEEHQVLPTENRDM